MFESNTLTRKMLDRITPALYASTAASTMQNFIKDRLLSLIDIPVYKTIHSTHTHIYFESVQMRYRNFIFSCFLQFFNSLQLFWV